MKLTYRNVLAALLLCGVTILAHAQEEEQEMMIRSDGFDFGNGAGLTAVGSQNQVTADVRDCYTFVVLFPPRYFLFTVVETPCCATKTPTSHLFFVGVCLYLPATVQMDISI